MVLGAKRIIEHYEDLYHKIENIHFKGMEEYNLAKALSTFLPSLFSSKNFSKEWLLRAVWHTIHANYSYDFTSLQEGKMLFFISENIRKDHNAMFEKMRSCAKNTDCLYGIHTQGKKLRWSWLGKIPNMLSWNKQMANVKIPFKVRVALIGEMVELALWLDLVHHNQHILLKHTALVNANEAMPRENVLAQFFVKHGIPTATMQHGHYNATRYIDEKRYEIGAAYLASVSDMFLAWGEYSKLEAEACGIPAEKIQIVGCPKYIDTEFEKSEPVKGEFGVILCGTSDVDDVDSSLIACAEHIYEVTGNKYVVKPHPAVRDTASKLLVGKKGVSRLCEATETVADYAKTVEYSICAGSTVYAELLKMGYVAYRSNGNNTLDRYSRIECGSFDNPEQLIQMRKYDQENPEQVKLTMNRINEMVFGGLNERSAYEAAFEKLLNLQRNM